MAGRSDYPLAAAIRTVKDGKSARAGLREFRQAGGSTNDAKWFGLVGEVRRNLSDRLDEVTRPLTRRPSGDEIRTFTTKRHTGYVQQLEIFVRDRATGIVVSKPYSWRTDTLITRGQAIREAIAEFESGVTESPDLFDEEILGGAYTGTYQLIPRGE